MNTPATQAQQFVTSPIVDLIEFDFTPVGGAGSVYIANSTAGPFEAQYPIVSGDGDTYQWVEFVSGGFRNDLTGQPNTPSLSVAAYNLWQLPEWAALTSGFKLSDYFGIIVLRQRFFYDTPTLIIPQRYYITQVESLNSTRIDFKLSGSFDSENLNRPSARKLEAL